MTNSVAMQQIFAPSDDVLTSDVSDKKVLMSLEQGNFIELNSTGRAIWERIDGKAALAEIASELRAIYDIPQEQCEAEVLQFVNDLRSQHLIQATN